jgi:hypothetical protein
LHLHEELASSSELDAETATMLREVLKDIERLLTDREAPGHETFTARLADATSDFEVTHPRLTAAVTQLAEALSGMGI